MKKICFCLLILMAHSCIPVKIAPIIKGEKIANAKKFKKDLPNCNGFIFEDTKNAAEFYNFMNAKYDLNHTNVESNIPITINNRIYYLSFFERERTTKTVNLIPFAVDAALSAKGNDPILDGLYTSRAGYWYIIMSVRDAELKDCLDSNYPQQQDVFLHLKKLKEEYFSTSNYIEAYLKMK